MSYYEMNGLGGTEWGGFKPTGEDVAQAVQGGVGLVAGATVAKIVTNLALNVGLTKTDAGYTYKAKDGTEVTVPLADATPARLDAGRKLGGKYLPAVAGVLPVLVGLGFYSKSQSSEGRGRIWWSSSGLGMIGYGIGFIFKSILERVNLNYDDTKWSKDTGYPAVEKPATWASTASAYIPFGAVDSYESNIVINGLGAGTIGSYMRRRGMNGLRGLGYSRNPGAPTFVQKLNGGMGRAPAEIQTLVSGGGISAAPMTSELVSLQGLSATLM